MSGIATAVVGSAVVGAYASKKSADKAAKAQGKASDASIAESRRQFDKVQELLKPYSEGGLESFEAQQNLVGLGGEEAQQEALNALMRSPQYTTLINQGEEAILQNASATGGLRGGNIQTALADFRPQILSQLIDSQFGKLNTLTGYGQASAAGQAAASQNEANMISNLLGQKGQAQAGAALAGGQAIKGVTDSFSNLATLKLIGAF